MIIFHGQIILCKNTEKTLINAENNIYQHVITHTLIGMKQWINASNFKKYWWELHMKHDLIKPH